MRERISRCIVAGVMAVACLSATPAQAVSFTVQTDPAYLNDVNANGTQGTNSTPPVPFYVLINTSNGKFVGAAKGKVVNNVHMFEYYPDSFATQITVSYADSYALTFIHDLYVVYSNGYAAYFATGTATHV